jgi:hypothetical protein
VPRVGATACWRLAAFSNLNFSWLGTMLGHPLMSPDGARRSRNLAVVRGAIRQCFYALQCFCIGEKLLTAGARFPCLESELELPFWAELQATSPPLSLFGSAR